MRGKHLEKFCWTKKRIISAILSAVLLATGIGFSTYAWLTATDTPEVNEFTGSKYQGVSHQALQSGVHALSSLQNFVAHLLYHFQT